MAFDLDNEELRATRKLHGLNDDLYKETSDKNVANVTKSDIDILNALIYVYEARLPNYNELMDSEVKSLKNILAERERDKKRIQELEEELEKANRQLDLDYVDDNYIPKQKVKEKIELHKNYLLNQAITSNPTLDSHFRDRENYLMQTLQELLKGGK